MIYSDGACSGNPGPGGYGTVLTHGEKTMELSAGYVRTTNNRMELMGAIEGLKALRYPCKVTITTDSQYVVNGITKGWARGWRARGWIKSDKQPAINPDLWGQLLDLCDVHDVSFEWVRGHAGHPMNERCDELAVAAAKSPDRKVDGGYSG